MNMYLFYTEIQDGRQKWQENDFLESSTVDSLYTLCVKNLIEIDLSCTISEINVFLRLTQKFKMDAKNGRKVIFAKSHQYTLQIPRGSKISSKSLYLTPFPRCVFVFYAEI